MHVVQFSIGNPFYIISSKNQWNAYFYTYMKQISILFTNDVLEEERKRGSFLFIAFEIFMLAFFSMWAVKIFVLKNFQEWVESNVQL